MADEQLRHLPSTAHRTRVGSYFGDEHSGDREGDTVWWSWSCRDCPGEAYGYFTAESARTAAQLHEEAPDG